jgi:predicted GTPase
MNEEYLAKMAAIAHIGVQTRIGRTTIERTLRRLQDEGRIKPIVYPNTILYSPEDIELVIKVLKGEA